MKVSKLFLALLLMISVTGYSQNVGKMDVKMEGFTQKKFHHTGKKIFIQQFAVNYQMIMVSYAKARGGGSGAYTFGSATAALALGLDGVTEEQLQSMTDRYYDDFVTSLEAKGFTAMKTSEIKEHEHFAGWEELQGGEPSMEYFPGYLSTSPKNFTYLNGKTSNGVLAGGPESKQLGGVIVARVNIIVPFAESQSINGGLVGGVAKVTARADLRVSPGESIPQKGDFKKPINLRSDITFMYKESLKWQAFHRGKLKNPIEIEGVLDEDKKYKSTSVSTTGSGFTTKYSEAYSDNAILVPCDPQKYEKGVNEAISGYINASVDGFMDIYN